MKRSRRRASAAVMAELREMFSGDVLREIMDITDHGEIVLTQVTSKDTTNEPHSDGRDVWTNVTEPLEYDRPHKPRLFHPAGILFRAPKKGESAILLRPKSASGRNAPGFGILLPDGGDGSSNFLPPWWGDNDSGLYAPSGETLHVEAKDKNVELTASGSGKTVNCNGSDHPMPKFDTFENDFATAWNQLIGVLQAGTQGSPAAQQLTGLSAVLAALQQFGTNLTNGTYNSQKAKNG